MTDDRRQQIEQRFDGELDGLEDVADDPEALRHHDRLAMLRDLAQRHDPASTVERRPFRIPERRPRRGRLWLAVSLAASAAAVVGIVRFWPRLPDAKSPAVVINKSPTLPPGCPVASIAVRPPLEVALYGWANTPTRSSGQAARLVLSPGSLSRKRSPADEILALELANDRTQPRNGVQRFAVAKGSRLAPPLKATNRVKSSPDA